MTRLETSTGAAGSAPILIRIVASRPVADRMLPEELVANLRIDPAVRAGQNGRATFLGFVLEGSGKIFDSMSAGSWLDGE